MNAHVPSPATITRARRAPHTVDPACPAEAIGRELERIYREISERQAGEGEFHERCGPHWNALAVLQLEDRARVLGGALEWTKARNLRGVAAQFAELQRANEQSRNPSVPSGEAERRVDRLSALIAAALGELAGLDGFQLGRGHGDADPSVFGSVLRDLTGEIIAEEFLAPRPC